MQRELNAGCAMTSATEKRECEYCRSIGAKHLVDGFYISAEIEENKLLLYEKECCTSETVQIGFCPMCGRDLRKVTR